MNSRKYIVFISMLSVSVCSFANMVIGEPTIQATANKALVEVPLKNTFSQSVKSARAWLIMLDDDGKIVGQKAEWVTGKDDNGKAYKKGEFYLKADSEQTVKLAIDTKRPATNVKVTFSRIILEDGSLVNIQKNVVAAEQADAKQ